MRWVVEVAVWWVLGTGVWLLGLSTVTMSDLVLGILAAFVGALVGAVGRRLVDGRWHPRARWLAQLPRVALAVVAETATVLAAAPRRDRPGRSGGSRCRRSGRRTSGTHERR